MPCSLAYAKASATVSNLTPLTSATYARAGVSVPSSFLITVSPLFVIVAPVVTCAVSTRFSNVPPLITVPPVTPQTSPPEELLNVPFSITAVPTESQTQVPDAALSESAINVPLLIVIEPDAT